MKKEVEITPQNTDIGTILARLMEFATLVGLAFAILLIVRTLIDQFQSEKPTA